MHSDQAIAARQSLTLRDGLRLTGHKRLDAFIGTTLDGMLALRRLDRRYQAVPAARDAAEFVRQALVEMDVQWEVDPRELEFVPRSGPAVIAANHPFGGIEGLLLAEIILGRRADLKILANAHLQRIVELKDLFITVNAFESKRASRENVQPLRDAVDWVRRGGALLIFPSGEVSHFQFRRARISDPEWRPSVGYILRRAEAVAVPAFVGGHNTLFFQLMGCIHPRLRTALLAREFLNMGHRSVHIRFGQPVAPGRVRAFASSLQLARYMRLRTYSLAGLDESERTRPAASSTTARAPAFRSAIIPAEDPVQLEREFDALPATQKLVASGAMQAVYARAGQIPCILAEIGRLRETTFRQAGEGTGRATDIDRFDRSYLHLFLWHGARREIVGAYRFAPVDAILSRSGIRGLYTYSLFRYRRPFIEGLDDAIELGRSFVRAEYQKSHVPLMLLWQGIARYVTLHPKYCRLFGAVSISSDYHAVSRQFMVEFLRENCFAEGLARQVRPRTGLLRRPATFWQREELADLTDINAMSDVVGQLENGERGVPILLRQYLKLGGLLLGFNVDRGFGDALDGLILVDLLRTDKALLQRYMGREESRRFLRFHAARRLGLDSPAAQS